MQPSPRKEDQQSERFLDYFYKHCAGPLFRPLKEYVPTHKNVTCASPNCSLFLFPFFFFYLILSDPCVDAARRSPLHRAVNAARLVAFTSHPERPIVYPIERSLGRSVRILVSTVVRCLLATLNEIAGLRVHLLHVIRINKTRFGTLHSRSRTLR